MISRFELQKKEIDIETVDDDQSKLEEELFQTVASSINKLGQWCIEVEISAHNFKANEAFTAEK